jgi:hypothetical protein
MKVTLVYERVMKRCSLCIEFAFSLCPSESLVVLGISEPLFCSWRRFENMSVHLDELVTGTALYLEATGTRLYCPSCLLKATVIGRE